jgi:hypothetical protein
MGIKKVGDRVRIFVAIKQLRNKSGTTSRQKNMVSRAWKGWHSHTHTDLWSRILSLRSKQQHFRIPLATLTPVYHTDAHLSWLTMAICPVHHLSVTLRGAHGAKTTITHPRAAQVPAETLVLQTTEEGALILETLVSMA